MNQKQFNSLKTIGHWVGMFFLVSGFALYLINKNGFYILAGIASYWLINYILIRDYIETKHIVTDENT